MQANTHAQRRAGALEQHEFIIADFAAEKITLRLFKEDWCAER
jgi:uncharacterized protein YutD